MFDKNEQYIAKTFNSYSIASLQMTYDSSKNIYIADQNAGEAEMFKYGNEIYKAIKRDNIIEIYEYVVVFNSSMDRELEGVYRNISDATNFQNPIKEVKTNGLTFDGSVLIKYYDYEGVKENLTEYKESASQYKLTFVKEDENYIFSSIEKIK